MNDKIKNDKRNGAKTKEEKMICYVDKLSIKTPCFIVLLRFIKI